MTAKKSSPKSKKKTVKKVNELPKDKQARLYARHPKVANRLMAEHKREQTAKKKAETKPSSKKSR